MAGAYIRFIFVIHFFSYNKRLHERAGLMSMKSPFAVSSLPQNKCMNVDNNNKQRKNRSKKKIKRKEERIRKNKSLTHIAHSAARQTIFCNLSSSSFRYLVGFFSFCLFSHAIAVMIMFRLSFRMFFVC